MSHDTCVCYAAPFSYLVGWLFPQYNVTRTRWVLLCSYRMFICGVVFSFYYENIIKITYKTLIFFFRIRPLSILNGSKNGIKWRVQNYSSQ